MATAGAENRTAEVAYHVRADGTAWETARRGLNLELHWEGVLVKKSALQLTEVDTVATALEDLAEGEPVIITDSDGREVAEVLAQAQIPRGHKIALRNICENAPVIKYGYSIGVATREIRCGDHVHTSNLASLRGRGDV